jgi:sugar diacid utilization regulator
VTITPAPVPSGREPDLVFRDHLSSLQGLLVLSMLMTESGDERHIVHLASTSVPSLGHGRLRGVYLSDGGWQATTGPCTEAEVRADLEVQLAALSSAGGRLGVADEAWGWAFPLRSLEGSFGYLVVSADRDPETTEQFLLRVLAQQTGIALANARLHDRERGTAEELRAANAALADTVGALQRSTAIHDRLTRVAAAGLGQQGIAQAVHELTGYAVAVEDRHGNLLAWSGPGRPDPYPKDRPAARDRMLRRALREGQPVREGGRLITVARPRRDVLGVLALIDPEAASGEQEQVALEHGSTVLAMELARLQSLAETEMRLRRDLVEELLAGTDEPSALARARALGYDLEVPHRVVVETSGVRGEGDAFFHAVRRAARDEGVGSLLVARGSVVVVLSNADQPWERFRAAVLRELGGGGRCRVGVGGPCAGPADFPRSHREAQLTLKMQRWSGGGEQATEFDRLGVYRILAAIDDPAGVERFVRDWLGSLLDYDARKHSELVATLGSYLDCGGSYDATSRALAVHRSTLKYRLQRIREISGHDLSDPDTHFNLELASRAWRTLSVLREAPR